MADKPPCSLNHERGKQGFEALDTDYEPLTEALEKTNWEYSFYQGAKLVGESELCGKPKQPAQDGPHGSARPSFDTSSNESNLQNVSGAPGRLMGMGANYPDG
jgi:hypothetical protein